MTHDPREALEIVQQMIRGKPMSAWITDTRTMKPLGDVVQEALTASPGEQEPVAAACADWGQLVQCLLRTMDHPHKGESSTEQAERMATELCRKYPPPPAAGWNEAIEAADDLYASLVDCEPKNNQQREAVEAYAKARNAMKALRRAAPPPEGVVKELANISTGQLFNALLGRINFDGMDPRTLSLTELKNAIDGAEWPR